MPMHRQQSSKAAAKKQADAAAAQEAQQQEIQREYAQAQTTYQNETLPAYQNQLNTLNNEMNQAQSDYNQAENSYQMAFQAWSADQSDDNENALEIAEQMRSEAQITYQNAKTAYEAAEERKLPIVMRAVVHAEKPMELSAAVCEQETMQGTEHR